jgi:predicted nucleic acid-binding protein
VNVIDSSAWLEYFANGPGADAFAAAIEDTGSLLVPSITVLEVFKRVLQQRDEGSALRCVGLMQQGRVVDLDASLALDAAVASARYRLPLADSVVFATARRANASLWTQDADFKGLPGVRYFLKR